MDRLTFFVASTQFLRLTAPVLPVRVPSEIPEAGREWADSEMPEKRLSETRQEWDLGHPQLRWL